MEERREKDIVADDITDITLIQVGYYWNSGYNEFDFTCKIKGEDDVLHMREQRHDDGNSLVIRQRRMISGKEFPQRKRSSWTINYRR